MNDFQDQVKNALNLIDKARKILIIPSHPVDGDAIGSGLALYLILKKLGKEPEIKYGFDRINFLKFLPGADKIEIVDLFDINLGNYDLAIFHDGGDLVQFYDNKKHRESYTLPEKPPILNIDHHPTNSHWTKDLVWDPRFSSVCEMIYFIFKDKVEFDKDISTNLFTGLSTDTGHFHHSNTTKRVFEMAGHLLDYGVDVPALSVKLYQSDPYQTVTFSGYLTSQIKINLEYKYAWFSVTYDEWQKKKLTMEELKNAVTRTRDSNLRSIGGTEFTFCLTEEQPGYIAGSWRSRISGLFDLTILAKIFNGGGHKEAAGFFIPDKTIAEAEKLVQDAIKSHYEEIKVK